ncbi:SPOR domain-containing protein [bacterium]|nr:SPOR domain-containing protein [bacterium]
MNNKQNKNYIIFLVLLFASCTSQTIQRTEQIDAAIEPPQADAFVTQLQPQVEDINYQPLDLPWFFKPHTPLLAEPYAIELHTSDGNFDESEHVSRIVDGFRVQIYSGKDQAVARNIENKLKNIYDINVYFLYEAPFYKVRIGNFEDRNSAARFGIDMRKNGFRDAWVVKSLITIE